MELDKLKLKTSNELNDEEKQFLRDHVSELNDEDKDAYADFLGNSTDNDVSTDASADSTPPADPESNPTPPAPTPNPEPQQVTFKTEEEARAFIEKTIAEKNAKEKQAAIDAAQTPEEKKYVEENWRPKDWNEGIKTIKDVVKEEIKAETAKEEQEKAERRKKLEDEWNGLVTQHNLPSPQTPEGQEVLKKVYDLGVKYKLPNFTEAYDLYSSLSAEKGGGFNPTVVKNQQSQSRREAAARVAGGTPSDQSGKKPLVGTYQELRGKSQSQLIRDAMKAMS